MKPTNHEIATILVHIFNCVVQSDINPDGLKISKVIPIFKNGYDGTPYNYTLHSILPCLNKLSEGVTEKHLVLL